MGLIQLGNLALLNSFKVEKYHNSAAKIISKLPFQYLAFIIKMIRAGKGFLYQEELIKVVNICCRKSVTGKVICTSSIWSALLQWHEGDFKGTQAKWALRHLGLYLFLIVCVYRLPKSFILKANRCFRAPSGLSAILKESDLFLGTHGYLQGKPCWV